MSVDFLALAKTGIQGLRPYQPGKPIEELQRELGLEDIVKLASNENPLGISDSVKKALMAGFNDLSRYPDGSGFRLKAALAEKFQLDAAQITLGNGSNEVIELLARVYAGSGDEIIYGQHAFAIYALIAQAIGAKGVEVPAQDYGHDLTAMLAAITEKTRLIFIANPNNPTGTWIDKETLENFLQKVPQNVIVVLDEAYFEYINEADYPDGMSFLARHSNLVVTRTFSKVYGLAALRVGYAVSNPAIADALNRLREPFNVNAMALIAAETALADNKYVRRSVELNVAGLAQLTQGLSRLNSRVIPSIGNFLCFHCRDAAATYQALLERGVIVRPIAGYGLPEFLRVSVGLETENESFLRALEQSWNS